MKPVDRLKKIANLSVVKESRNKLSSWLYIAKTNKNIRFKVQYGFLRVEELRLMRHFRGFHEEWCEVYRSLSRSEVRDYLEM